MNLWKRWILQPVLLLLAGVCSSVYPAEAVEVRAVAASGGLSASSTQHLWSVIGEPAVGPSSGATFKLESGFVLATASADSTPPTTPVVTDDGEFTPAVGRGPVSSTPASGGLQQAANHRLWSALGEPGAGRLSGSSRRLELGFLAAATAPSPARPTALHAVWSSSDPESGIVEYQYAIGTTPGGTDVVPWTSVGASTELIRSDLALQDGRTYYITVRARNGAGQWSSIGTSDGITVDTTPPTTPVVTDDGATTTSTTQLHATWASSDAQSGIAEYQYRILQGSPTGSVLVDWTSVGSSTELTATGLTLLDGVTYFIGVRAKNGAGILSPTGYSDGITVRSDSTPPSGTLAINNGAAYAASAEVTLTLSATDNSGSVSQMRFSNDGATYSVPEAYATTKNWTLTSGDGSKTVYAKFQDAAGNWSSPATDTILLDTTGPTVPTVSDDGAFTSSRAELHAAWSSSDPESGIVEYQYAIGTTSGGTEVVPWTSTGTAVSVTKAGLSLTNGTAYYFIVRAKNGAGLWSAVGSSDGITVLQGGDTTPPTPPVVTDDGLYSTFPTSLHASWSSSDPESGIAEYRYRIFWRDRTGTFVIADWTSAGTAREVTRDGLVLAGGETHYFAVEARNGLGLWSEAGVSNGIKVDFTAPYRPSVTDDGVYTSSRTQLHAQWTTSDFESGIAEYHYAIGTTPEDSDVAGWTSSGPRGAARTEVTRTGLSLSDGTKYYFAVKALNSAGLWSEVAVSNGITVDASAPDAPVVADDGETTPRVSSFHARWSGGDPHSGIVEYQYRITEGSPEGAVVVDWSSAGTATEVTRRGLSLRKSGPLYYLSAKARNGSGLWSPIGASDGIRVVNEAPVLEPIGDRRIHVLPPPAPPPSGPSGGNSAPQGQTLAMTADPAEKEPPLLFVKVSPEAAPRMEAAVHAGERLRQRGSPAHLRRILQGGKKRGLTLAELCCRHQVGQAKPLFARSEKAAGSSLEQIFRLDLACHYEEIASAAEEFTHHPQVLYCEPRMWVKLFQTPDDPYLSSSGSWGQLYPDLWGLKRIQAESAWDVTAGSSDIVVAVVDTGIDPNHPDLFPNLWSNPWEVPGNGLDDDGNGYPDDTWGWNFVSWDGRSHDAGPTDGHGHGTHVAGTIAAVGNNGQGIVGVAWRCRVMALKGLSDDGVGSYDDLARAVVYATDNGARVINMSWGGEGQSQLLEDVLRYAHDRNVVLVAAAGNSNEDALGSTPASIREVITVAASDQADHKASFSNWGTKIDVVAPGGGSADPADGRRTYVNILSCRARGTDIYGDGSTLLGEYARARGTSMAAPHAAGLCALILSRHPEFTNEEVREVLRTSADDITDPLNDGTSFPGPDIYTGAGRINAARAVRVDSVPVALITSPQEWMSVAEPLEIVGEAYAAQGFLRYRLEEGTGLNPSSWRLLRESTTPVRNGVLGTWDPRGGEVGPHLIRLTVWVMDLPQGRETTVPVQVMPPMLRGWPKPLAQFIGRASSSTGDVAIVDMDQDGQPEVLTQDGRRFDLRGQLLSQPAFSGGIEFIEDLTGDGRQDLLLSIGPNWWSNPIRKDFALVDADGLIQPGWPLSLPGRRITAVEVGDADGDGLPELAFGGLSASTGSASQSAVYVLRSDGTALPGWPKQIAGSILNNMLAWVDFDGDGRDELVVGFGRYDPGRFLEQLEFYSGGGTLLATWDYFGASGNLSTLIPADLDADGDEELLGRTRGGPVFAWGRPGVLLPGWPVGQGFWRAGPGMCLADLDGDGMLELLAPGGPQLTEIWAWRSDGTSVSGWPAPATGLSGAIWRETAHVRAVDLDGDRLFEVLVSPQPHDLARGLGSGSTALIALRNDGTVLPGWPVDLKRWGSEEIDSKLIFFDQDGDRQMEVAVLDAMPWYSTRNRSRLWILGADGQSKPGWPIGARAFMYIPHAGDLDGNGDVEMMLQARPLGGEAELWAFDLQRAGLPGPPSDPVTVPRKTVVGDGYHIDVTRIYPRPLVNGEKGYLEIHLRAGDANRDRLTFSAEGLPRGAVFKPHEGLFSWKPSSGQAGTYQVTFAVTDGGVTDSERITISVQTDNRAPQMTPPPAGTVLNEGEFLDFTLKATDPDGDTLQFVAGGLPPGATVDRRTGRLTWRPNYTQAGEYLFSVAATDGSLEDRRNMRVAVSNVNRAPVLTVPDTITIQEGKILEFLLDAVEPDAEAILFSVSGLPPGATLVAETGLFSWQPTFAQAGSYGPIQIRASDGTLSDTETLVVTVQDARPWTTPPIGPVLNVLPSSTNVRTLTLSGTKPAYTSVWINGTEVVARDRLTTWTASVSLSEGNNVLSVRTRDVADLASFTIQRMVLLDTVAPGLTITAPSPGQVIFLTVDSGGGG